MQQTIRALDAAPEKMNLTRVLLVEDEFLMRQALRTSLEDVGLAVEEAASAAQAFDRMKRAVEPIHAAIVDIGLPDLKGDRLAVELRALYPTLPILITSGYDLDVLRERFRDDVLMGFLGKPYVMRQLADMLRSLGVNMGTLV